jgi:CBS domain-containing protein
MKTIGLLLSGREVYHIADDQSVREAARYMTERRVGAVAVLAGDRLAGILSERDIMGRVVGRTKDTHEDGLRKMKQAGCRHLPVVEGDHLVGMVSQRDLLQVDLTEKDEEIRWLNAYIHFIPPAKEGTS